MICEMIWDPSWILKLYLYQRINSPCPEISIRSVNNKPVTTATRIPSVFSKSDIFLNGGKEVIHGLITTGIYYEVCQTTKRQYNFLASAESHRSATNRYPYILEASTFMEEMSSRFFRSVPRYEVSIRGRPNTEQFRFSFHFWFNFSLVHAIYYDHLHLVSIRRDERVDRKRERERRR